MAPFSADLDAPDQIAFRNDADQPCVDIDDRERAYAVTDHRIGRDLNRDIGANRDNPTNHHVPRLHVGLPSFGAESLPRAPTCCSPGGHVQSGQKRRPLQSSTARQLPLCPVNDRIGAALQYVAKAKATFKHVYWDRSNVIMLRCIPFSGQFGMTRQGVSTCSRSPSILKLRACSVPTHSGFQATSTLVIHLSPSIR